jgi:cytochrome P450
MRAATELARADSFGDIGPPFYPSEVAPARVALDPLSFLFKFIDNPLSVLPEAVYREKIVQHGARRFGRVAWIVDPALIKDILVDRSEQFAITHIQKRVFGSLGGRGVLTSEGTEWRWQRQTVAPLFRHSELLRYVPAMSRGAEVMLAIWADDRSGGYRAIERDMTRVAFDVIAQTLLPDGGDDLSAQIERASGDYFKSIPWTFTYSFFRLPSWTPHPGRRSMRKSERFLRASMAELIAAGRGTPPKRDDLFTRLSRAKHPETGEAISSEMLLDSLLTFMMVGHESTAKALCWTLYLLSQSETWTEKLQAEIADVAGDAPIGPEHIDRLQLTQQVIKESLRLYPPVPSITRSASSDTVVGGEAVSAGTLINIPIFALHRHSKLWDDPARFDPDRFAPENAARIPRTQFMPFGAGPRTCIGGSFAQIEITAVIATLLRKARFRLQPGYVPTPLSRVTLSAKGGMPMRIEMRKRAGRPQTLRRREPAL